MHESHTHTASVWKSGGNKHMGFAANTGNTEEMRLQI